MERCAEVKKILAAFSMTQARFNLGFFSRGFGRYHASSRADIFQIWLKYEGDHDQIGLLAMESNLAVVIDWHQRSLLRMEAPNR